MSPQATLLALGVLLLLAAGVTFLAVTWDSLPVAAQAAIMGTLATIALIGAIPMAKHKLAGTAEALAILGCGLLIVDLYGIRALGLITASDALTYTAAAAAIVAAVNLLMNRLAPTVKTFGLAAVIVGQLPLPLFLADRVDLAALLLGLLIQLVITLYWSAQGTRTVRITGAICSATVFAGILLTGSTRVLIALVADRDPNFADFIADMFGLSATAFVPLAATTAIVCLTAATGILLLNKRTLPGGLTPTPGEILCTATAAFTVATFLPQIPEAGRWLTTALATVLVLVELLRPRRTGRLTTMLLTATTTSATVAVLVSTFSSDVRQLSLIAALVAALALVAGWRKRLEATTTAATAGFAAQLAIVLAVIDEFITLWTGGIALAVVAACSIAAATRYVGRPPERALLISGATAALLAEIVILLVSPGTGTGVVLTIAAAPLVAYGMQPGRRDALLVAGLLLIFANTGFVLGTDTTTVEWFTVPPAVIMLALGILRWRDQPSWLFLGPGLLLGLVPSALLADGNDILRTTLVITAAVAVILAGTRFSLQAPFVVGAAVLTKIGLWQFLEVAPLIPRWITLALAGLILLTVGATYERRLHQAKQAARWLTSLR
ncbi:SCO7613 C-terminal domain-containing membrane protein [Kribbella caucasensis]|uniref:SCO7613 C-terminal domain-containing membrane protein n=1 Tax=Kribbella caucasensis TaxID=2512215 RepID=UPI0010621165|nr:hypothetical protein [Kribbella sp. VKM Ac-2527]